MRQKALVLCSLIAFALVPGRVGAGTGDPYSDRQWGLATIEAERAWEVAEGSQTVIAIVDSGVDLRHPDLRHKIVSRGADFVQKGDTDGAQDRRGHGTHVAGIAAASTGNGIGIAGVAPRAKILPVRVIGRGTAPAKRVAAGIRYASRKGAEVINISLGVSAGRGEAAKVTGALRPVYRAINRAWSRGSVVVIAAGNNGFPLCSQPSAHRKALCVGATDRSDTRAFYSNSDATQDGKYLVAPGGGGVTCSGDVFSTYLRKTRTNCSRKSGYEALAGTSMAAPHVSGVAALLAGKGLSNKAVVECLLNNTDDLGYPGRDRVYGYGRVNAYKAVSNC